MTGTSSNFSAPTTAPKANPKIDARPMPLARQQTGLGGQAAGQGFQQAQPITNAKRAFADALSNAKGPAAKLPQDETKADISSLGAISPRDLFAAPAAVQHSPAGDVDPAMQAHLERIAAAIAEVAKTGEPQIQLDLPLGAYRIESAVLGRDIHGQLSIALIPATAVPPAVAAQWSEQLQERLMRREVRGAKIGVQAPTRRAVSAA